MLAIAVLLLADASWTGILFRVAEERSRKIFGVLAAVLGIVMIAATRQAFRPMVLWEAGREGIRNHVDYLGRWHEGEWIPWSDIATIEYKREISGESILPVIWLRLRDEGSSKVWVSALKPKRGDPQVALQGNGDPSGEAALAQLDAMRQRLH